MRSTTPRIAAMLVLAIGLPVMVTAPGAGAKPARKAAVNPPPNVVIILTDDQPPDTVAATIPGTSIDPMPHLHADLVEPGLSFANAYLVNPLCCPSRASLLTGQYSHTTHVYENNSTGVINLPPVGSVGGIDKFDPSSTMGTWLRSDFTEPGVHYDTAYIGKWLNDYDGFGKGRTYPAAKGYTGGMPPGWSHWAVFDNLHENGGAGYINYALNVDGERETYCCSPTPDVYSTDVLAEKATDFIDAQASDEDPFFMIFAVNAPHRPAIPAQEYADLYDGQIPDWAGPGGVGPASVDEPNIHDKPAWLRSMHPGRLREVDITRINNLRVRMYATLRSLDDAIHDIVTRLEDTGQLENTMIVYVTDNGWMRGEHRLVGKLTPYEESSRTPLIIRWDAKVAGTANEGRIDSTHLVTNIDIAPTVAEAAGIDPTSLSASTPRKPVDGASLMPILDDGDYAGAWREDFLIESTGTGPVPAYCAVRTRDPDDSHPSRVYAFYGGPQNRELYDLSSDPLQLTNMLGNPAYASEVAADHARLFGSGPGGKGLCQPVPPRMVDPTP